MSGSATADSTFPDQYLYDPVTTPERAAKHPNIDFTADDSPRDPKREAFHQVVESVYIRFSSNSKTISRW